MKRVPFEVSVVEPCQQQWGAMSGTSAQKHCDSCNKTVHNFAAMTPKQIERLVVASGSGICARLIRRDDGSLVTAPGAQSSQSVLTILSAALLTALPAAAQVNSSAKSAIVHGVVKDPVGATIHGAKVRLTQPDSSEIDTVTNEAGSFSVQALRGQYSISVEMPGFGTWVRSISLTKSRQSLPAITLPVGMIEMGVIVTVDRRPWYKRVEARTARLLHVSSLLHRSS